MEQAAKGQSYEDWKAGIDPAPKPKAKAGSAKAAAKVSGKAKAGAPLGIEKLTAAQKAKLDSLLASSDIDAKGDVSDLFGRATGNKAVDGWCHIKSYWTPDRDEAAGMTSEERARWSTDQLGIEGFAESYSAYCCNPASKAALQRYFPESARLFEEMLE